MAGTRMPNYVRGVAAAGVEALRAIATSFAGWQLAAPIDTSLPDPEALATEYLTKLSYPEHVFDRLPEDAQDRVALAIGGVAQAAWISPPVPPGTPSYKAPSWEGDVFRVLFAKAEAPVPTARVELARSPSHAAAWPELGSLAAWKKARNRAAVTRALVAALGKGWKAIEPVGAHRLPRVRSSRLGLALVAVPGGTLRMGLSADEQRELARRVKPCGPEAVAHVRALAGLARPVHPVTIDAFLCAETPLLAAHAGKLGGEGDPGNAHGVLRVDSETAAAMVTRSALRLLGEAEWEWVARAGGAQSWLSGTEAPAAWAARVIATKRAALAHPLGVLALGWGEWVDDGWHASYRGAPRRSAAWTPQTRPEVVRGGALALWPWQGGGEQVLCHAAARERAHAGAHAVRLAHGLPAR